ncbi:MAG: EF-P beta-lysylation protein EpmB [Wenzhouxiangella sp.]
MSSIQTQSRILPRTPAKPKRSDWREQLRQAYREPASLLHDLGLASQALAASAQPAFPMLVPRAFARRMQPGNANDPLLRQVLPVNDETVATAGFVSDPVGDQASRQARGVLHKYQGRALLITTGACAVHCRYCFRQAFPYSAEQAAHQQWQAALDYLASETSVDEVILSGGDPLMLATERLRQLTDALQGLPHIKRLRIHTRLPVVLPARVTNALCRWLAELPWPVVMVIHANHANEFDADVDQAIGRLAKANVHLLNQAVLLAGVNDSVDALAALMERSLAARVLPYYLHVLDRVSGAQRFERSDEEAIALIEQLRRRLSGYLVPRLVREVAGEPYKQPLI